MKNNKFAELWNKGIVRLATFSFVFVVAVVSLIVLTSKPEDKVPPLDYGEENQGKTEDENKQVAGNDEGQSKPEDENQQVAGNDEGQSKPEDENQQVAGNDEGQSKPEDENQQVAGNDEGQSKPEDENQQVAGNDEGQSKPEDENQQVAGNDEGQSKPEDENQQVAGNDEGQSKPEDENKQVADNTGTEKEPELSAVEVMQNAIGNLSFNEADGLTWPVKGDVLLNYSIEHLVYHKTLDQFRTNPAVLIGAAEGSEVTAAAAGVITSIENTYKTGWTVTTAIGNGYTLVYGHLNEVSCKVGDIVEEGDVIATVSQPAKPYALEGNSLYFQVLNNGTSVNPMMLLGE